MYSIISWCDSGLIIENRGSLVYKGREGKEESAPIQSVQGIPYSGNYMYTGNLVKGSVMGLFEGRKIVVTINRTRFLERSVGFVNSTSAN